MDLVIANSGTDSVAVFLKRRNNGQFFPSMDTYPTGNDSAPYSVAVADFNDDTYLDIVVTNSKTDNIMILLGFGNGKFRIGRNYSTGPQSRPYGIFVSDFNRDDISDIAVANSGTSGILVLYGDGNGTFTNGTLYPLGYGYYPYSITVADLNNDGRMDIVVACYDTNHIEILLQMC